MPKHGGHTITQLMARHADALQYISRAFNDRIGVFAEGLGGYVCFYLAFAGGAVKSAIFQNAPAILTEEKFRAAIFGGAEPAAERRRSMLPLVKPLSKLVPWLKLPISTYLDFQELIDTVEENRRIEAPIVQSFYTDPVRQTLSTFCHHVTDRNASSVSSSFRASHPRHVYGPGQGPFSILF